MTKLPFNTTRFIALATLALATGTACSAAPEDFEDFEDFGELEDELYPLSSALWIPNLDTGFAKIPVCWNTAGSSTAKGWVKDAIQQSWELVAKVTFTGWGSCASGAKGIRISIRDEGPHTTGLGRALDGKSEGMVLNFTFKEWSKSCAASDKRESCIRGIAMHEFGHALGLAHEQNRPDSPISCTADPQGTDGDLELGAFDKDSVMNYCNNKWNNNGRLSTNDVKNIRRLYGATRQECFIGVPGCWPIVVDGDAPLRYGDLVAVGSKAGKYLRVDSDNDVRADKKHFRSHEKFTIVDPVDGTVGGALEYGDVVAFRSHKGNFLSGAGGKSIVTKSRIGFDEMWGLERPAGISTSNKTIDVADPIVLRSVGESSHNILENSANPKLSGAAATKESWYLRGPVSQ